MEDALILIISISAFIVFIGLFVTNIAHVSDQDVFKHIKKTFFLGAGAGFLFAALTLSFIIMAISMLLYGLMAFIFVLCIFGPYETSIRIKLIDVIGEDGGGKASEYIDAQYNGSHVLDVRLKRLTGNGDVVTVGDKYRAVNQPNAFFIIEKLALLLRRYYRISSS